MSSSIPNTGEIGVRLYQTFILGEGREAISVQELAQLLIDRKSDETIWHPRTIYKYFDGSTNFSLDRLRILQENIPDVDMPFLILGKHSRLPYPKLNSKENICWYFDRFYSKCPMEQLEQKTVEEKDYKSYSTIYRYRKGRSEPPLIWLLWLENVFPDLVNLEEWLFHPINE